jgi:hypothetical protein
MARSVALCARTSWSDLYEEAAVDKCRFCDVGVCALHVDVFLIPQRVVTRIAVFESKNQIHKCCKCGQHFCW